VLAGSKGPDFWSWVPPKASSAPSGPATVPAELKLAKETARARASTAVLERSPQSAETLNLPFQGEGEAAGPRAAWRQPTSRACFKRPSASPLQSRVQSLEFLDVVVAAPALDETLMGGGCDGPPAAGERGAGGGGECDGGGDAGRVAVVAYHGARRWARRGGVRVDGGARGERGRERGVGGEVVGELGCVSITRRWGPRVGARRQRRGLEGVLAGGHVAGTPPPYTQSLLVPYPAPFPARTPNASAPTPSSVA